MSADGSDVDPDALRAAAASIPELPRLWRDIIIPPPRRDRAHRPHWPAWLRRHQYRARQAHHRWNACAEKTP